MVINKNNLKHTWTRVFSSSLLLLLHRLSSLFFPFFQELFGNSPTRTLASPAAARTKCNRCNSSVRRMSSLNAFILSCTSWIAISAIFIFNRFSSVCNERSLFSYVLFFFFLFFFFKIRWPYIILNFSRVFVIHSIPILLIRDLEMTLNVYNNCSYHSVSTSKRYSREQLFKKYIFALWK